MIEALSIERPITIETLVETLREAVKEANDINPDVLGLILYGSRTHAMTRSDSDVDMIIVQREGVRRLKTYLALQNAVKTRLKTLDIRSHFEGPLWIDNAADLPIQWWLIERECKWLDKDSIFIIVDPTAERTIRDIIKPEERIWSKAGLHPSRRFD